MKTLLIDLLIVYMQKPHFVLVHSFPSNSIVLAGFIEFLSEFFTVHPIDLPGFTTASPPLKQINVKNYAAFLEHAIQSLELDSYLVAGISFGFYIISHCVFTSGCKGIIAMEPYLGKTSLRISRKKKVLYMILTDIVRNLRLSSKIWDQKLANRFGFFSKHPEHIKNAIFGQIDGATFFQTLRLLTTSKNLKSFHRLPHVVILNPNDYRINADYVLSRFGEELESCLVLTNAVPHFPPDVSAAYFRKHMPKEQVHRLLRYFNLL